MLKNSASGVHAGHCRLTVRAASTDVPHHIRRGTNLKSPLTNGVGRVRSVAFLSILKLSDALY